MAGADGRDDARPQSPRKRLPASRWAARGQDIIDHDHAGLVPWETWDGQSQAAVEPPAGRAFHLPDARSASFLTQRRDIEERCLPDSNFLEDYERPPGG